MHSNSYPKSVNDVVTTLTDICQHQGNTELVLLLKSSHAYFDTTDYDNYNGGTTTWALRLEVPTPLFATIQQRLQEIEKELLNRLDYLDRLFPNDPLAEVTVTPFTDNETALGQRMTPSDTDVQRIWKDGYFRLFLSHVSEDKIFVGKLKTALLDNVVSAFVAHENIEPAQEWQNEISLALRSMHALAALMTIDFHKSDWTDQEVGWALGRGVPVLPISLGLNPYGFVGKIQAIPGSLENLVNLANQLTQALLGINLVHGQMRSSLVVAFENSDSWAVATRLSEFVCEIVDFTETEKSRLIAACNSRKEIKGARAARQAIYSYFGVSETTDSGSDPVPF